MDTAVVYAKTELGLREIKERRLKLPVPMRGLLIMIDGHRTVADVMEKAKALHLDSSALEALEVGGLIVKRFSPTAVASNDENIAPRDLAEAQRLMHARDRLAVGDPVSPRNARLRPFDQAAKSLGRARVERGAARFRRRARSPHRHGQGRTDRFSARSAFRAPLGRVGLVRPHSLASTRGSLAAGARGCGDGRGIKVERVEQKRLRRLCDRLSRPRRRGRARHRHCSGERGEDGERGLAARLPGTLGKARLRPCSRAPRCATRTPAGTRGCRAPLRAAAR